MKKDDYLIKLEECTSNYLNSTIKPIILEFGVRHGISTEFFLSVCEKNDGFLYSVDMDDTSKKFNSKKWKFIQIDKKEKQYLEKTRDWRVPLGLICGAAENELEIT